MQGMDAHFPLCHYHKYIFGLGSRSYAEVTVFPLKNATTFNTKSNFWKRRLKEGGIYQRAAFIRGNTVCITSFMRI